MLWQTQSLLDFIYASEECFEVTNDAPTYGKYINHGPLRQHTLYITSCNLCAKHPKSGRLASFMALTMFEPVTHNSMHLVTGNGPRFQYFFYLIGDVSSSVGALIISDASTEDIEAPAPKRQFTRVFFRDSSRSWCICR